MPTRRSRSRPEARSDPVTGGSDHSPISSPASLWARLRVPLIADEAIHPLDRVLGVADFPNGFGNAGGTLADLRGRLGTATQSLLISAR